MLKPQRLYTALLWLLPGHDSELRCPPWIRTKTYEVQGLAFCQLN